ncbi:MAG: hypothetical protein DI556_08990 [Rhodovulum sulfidophilum]|uniref:Major facilitator superfamily (MFS) profile domain-containing protein n=1 Tax=Rhodovulum sulfidophilum TaxID=35806 RepID=A0A2W5ND67_RHOSU|nr:MAG: hypothetical protein DI556_08990 [Rhodovulum sulfidophilum]
MLRTLASLTTLIAAASLVNLANATMTTIMPLRLLEDGASGTVVALFGAVFFLGFAIGCFSQPPLIERVGYIRAFAATAAVCTILAVVMDRLDSVKYWLALRFLMGVSLAAVFAAVDGWINGTTTDAMRGKVFATYGWCLGASAVVSQLVLTRFDGMSPGFITVLALAFNLGLVLVAMTRSAAPSTALEKEKGAEAARPAKARRGLVFTSGVSVATAIYAGLVATAILSILPATLAGGGVDDEAIGAVIGAFFLGRLLLQIPLGVVADRMDLRLLVAIIAGLTGATALVGALLVKFGLADLSPGVGRGGRLLFLAIMTTLGGLVLPLYTLANSLAFARARGLPAARVATSLLLVNSAGSVAGPLLVAGATPILGTHALPAVVGAASGLMVAAALAARRSAPPEPATVGFSFIPATSVTSSGSMAEAKYEEAPGPE